MLYLYSFFQIQMESKGHYPVKIKIILRVCQELCIQMRIRGITAIVLVQEDTYLHTYMYKSVDIGISY